MMLDPWTLLTFVVLLLLCGTFVYFVSFGAKEVSYEEALKEATSTRLKEEKEKKDKRERKQAAATAKQMAKKAAKRQTNKQDDVPEDSRSNTPLLNEEPVVVSNITEESPQSTPEPPAPVVTKKAGKKNNNKASKMVIEEVEEPQVIEVEEEVVVQAVREAVEEIKPEPKKAPANKKAANKKQEAQQQQQKAAPALVAHAGGKMPSSELISAVKKTPLDDSEAQQLIDILLNKQAGAPSQNGGDWVDLGTKGAGNDLKQLQKSLAEKESLLVEQEGTVQGLKQKLGGLRTELNAAKSEKVAVLRQSDDVNGRHQQEVNALQSRLQVHVDQHNRDVSGLQTQNQFQLNQIATLEQERQKLAAAAVHIVAPVSPTTVVDPALLAELEQLRTKQSSSESELTSLKQSNNSRMGDLEKQLSTASQDLSSARKEKDSLADKVKGLTGLEKTISELRAEIKKTSEQSARLSEDNERLSEQLASNMERPRAEGQESGKQNGDSNGHESNGKEIAVEKEKVARLQETDVAWQKKFQSLTVEKETILKEKDSGLKTLNCEVAEYKNQVQKIQADLDSQKAKNDELRSKNWKAMDALSSAEQSYAKLLKQNQSNKSNEDLSGAIAKASRDSENAFKALLLRLFPGVEVADKKDHESWVQAFAESVKAPALKKEEAAASDDEDLKKQVAKYKTVLAQTEGMLTHLQANVETEEGQWKARLAKAEEERTELERKNATLQASLGVVNQAEEMQTKLQELQTKLSEEEDEKGAIMAKFSTAEKRLKEQLKVTEELESLRGKYEAECKRSVDLGAQVAKMGQVLSTSQEALQQEQKTVEMLREANVKDGAASPSSSSENGPKTDQETTPKTPASANSSQVGSVASLDLSDSNTPKKDKTKKKKKLFGLLK